MPIATRPHEVEGNPQGRRPFRSVPDFKRPDFNRPDFKRSKGNGSNYVRNNNNGRDNNRTAPPESTNAENFYYLKQMNSRTPMVIVMTDHGHIIKSLG